MGLIRLKGLILKILYAGGGKRIRTADHLVANQALSQLSYTPKNSSQSQVQGSRLKGLLFKLLTFNFELFWWA